MVWRKFFFLVSLAIHFLSVIFSFQGSYVWAAGSPAARGGSTTGSSNTPSEVPAPYAAGTEYGGPTQVSALVDPNYQKCGQDCHYQKANENISLQADYILKKIEYLNLPSKYAPSSTKREILGSFCRTTEPVDDCVDRYVNMNRFWFVKVRSALGKNQESYNKFHCAKLSEDGSQCLIKTDMAQGIETDPDLDNSVNTPKMAQVAYFSKYDQLRTAQPNPQQLASVQDGVMDNVTMQNYEPNKDDFIRFKKISADPSNPGAGTLEVPETGANRYDDAAYQKALSAWKLGQFHQDVQVTVAGRKDLGNLRVQDKQNFQNDSIQNGVSTTRTLYNEARGEYIDQINDYISQQSPFNSTSSSVTFPGTKQNSGPQAPGAGGASDTGVHTGDEQVNVPMASSDTTGAPDTSVYYDTYSPNGLSGTSIAPAAGQQGQQPGQILNPFF